MTPRIKICGITREVDALYAAALGVDALGFIFADSPRQVEPEVVRKISMALPPFVSTVGVFVDTAIDKVKYFAATCRLDWIQLHGKESPTECADLGLPVLKAIRVKDMTSIQAMEPYKGFVGGFVLDTYVKGQKGGTGKTFEWALAQEAKQYGPVILAGGLTPDDVDDAVQQVSPYGVDVSSGVEIAPGIKDHDKIRRFVERARACERIAHLSYQKTI